MSANPFINELNHNKKLRWT